LNTREDFEAILVEEPLRFDRSDNDLFDYKDKKEPAPMTPLYSISNFGVLIAWSITGSLDTLEARFMYRNQNPNLKSLLDKE
jgi:hypothetical protein